jgi:hypothetical protein
LSTGGLEFVHNPNVQMRSEQLFISTTQIRVTYHFFNASDQPVVELVAFPMPDITFDNPDADIAIPTQDPLNFLGFTTTANGQPASTRVEQKAYAMGVDQSAVLRQLNIPLAPQLEATSKALKDLPHEKLQHLIDLGLVVDEIDQFQARWTLKTTYYWQQTFPVHQELVITHQYKPSVGNSAGTAVGNSQSPTPADYKTKYCMDPDFIAAATRAQQAADQAHRTFGEFRMNYILTTGANWAGPITDFTLTVDKGRPANLISFCGTGVKKISPTRFQVHYSNFTPTANLAILILADLSP